MSVKKLPDDIQSIICSSNNITNYKRTVEELIYNSLDAKSTSIAIRIHIQEYKIQVVDNGCGIAEKDFNLLGQKYATSKCVNLSNFKSAPNTYGFRGQALSNIVDTSKHVKITSKSENSEKTWSKSFYVGKEQSIVEVAARPSKGTTVEINGLFYKSKIKRKSMNAMQELIDIKTFLEQLSLAHTNVSFTLRDDNTNEIVFKMHKNRDIYQKIKTLFNIDKDDIQELQVEKHKYKTIAYIGKKCDEKTLNHWIFLNNKIVKNSKLNKMVQKYFTKYLKSNCKKEKVKSKSSVGKDESKKCIPFYIIFLSCPYYDYDISLTPKNSFLEFKNWKPITKILEKLIKFYFGDISLNKTKPEEKGPQEETNLLQEIELREKVREITRKFLGSQSKKLGVSQMQNGIKGKLIKRRQIKMKNTLNAKKPSTERLNNLLNKTKLNSNNNIASPIADENIISDAIPIITQKTKQKKIVSEINSKHYKSDLQKIRANKIAKVYDKRKMKIATTVECKPRKITNISKKAFKYEKDELTKIFENQPEDVKRRCDILAKEADKALRNQKVKQTVTINETVNYSNFVKGNKNITIRKRVGEIITHDIIPLKRNFRNEKRHVIHQDRLKTSHNLLKTILGSQDIQVQSSTPLFQVKNKKIKQSERNVHSYHRNCEGIRQLTYESHNYNKHGNEFVSHHESNKVRADQTQSETQLSPMQKSFNDVEKHKNLHFISKRSRDNFVIPKTTHAYLKLRKKKSDALRKRCLRVMDICDEDISIADTINNTNRLQYNRGKEINFNSIENIRLDRTKEYNGNEVKFDDNIVCSNEIRHSMMSLQFGYTYTLTSSNDAIMNIEEDSRFKNHSSKIYCNDDYSNIQCSFHIKNLRDENSAKNNCKNIVFVSNSQVSKDGGNHSCNIEPMDICEPIINSFDSNRDDYNGLSYNFNRLGNDLNQNLSLLDSNNHVNNLLLSPPLTQELLSKNHLLTDYNVNEEANVVLDQENLTHYMHINAEAINNENNGDDKNDDHVVIPESNYFAEGNKRNHPSMHINAEAINNENNGDDKNDDHVFITESNYFAEGNKRNDPSVLNTNVFNLRNRPRFLPKGMSPIFENCNSKKNLGDYNFDKEYFENILYDNFNDDVQTNIEIYGAKVQNANDITTKDIEKFNSRLEKDNSTLTFSPSSLKEAKVLTQVDNKFIGAILNSNLDSTDYLVLFDQHAVHERIRLERNLADYFDDGKWKSVSLDDLALKLTSEEILYLHNYRDKFNHFGLDWTIVNENEIKVHTIPLAILGKNHREVDKVMKTVKSLITEVISNIISQKGCVSSYPKSIMDLVSNEACRYAIMFGDTLSKKECHELLQSLSACKTPFQCAHGRPVMGVMMEFKPEPHQYKINLKKVLQFKTKLNNK